MGMEFIMYKYDFLATLLGTTVAIRNHYLGIDLGVPIEEVPTAVKEEMLYSHLFFLEVCKQLYLNSSPETIAKAEELANNRNYQSQIRFENNS